jgi:hypothetical protein
MLLSPRTQHVYNFFWRRGDEKESGEKRQQQQHEMLSLFQLTTFPFVVFFTLMRARGKFLHFFLHSSILNFLSPQPTHAPHRAN